MTDSWCRVSQLPSKAPRYGLGSAREPNSLYQSLKATTDSKYAEKEVSHGLANVIYNTARAFITSFYHRAPS